ncbi:Succinate dehydrogenase assembly factor 2 mitochondrial [Tieghemiomyces parasiticus]|uniref:Succinate dehydrogenase assembly factor 2, mitochondrial n=1 Tax=Tieghemiomyces parasiticus TaxID=78921 RepID=A0A9W8DIK3_9FUNG|nr:Succinate dehydrogenase assembly factor 2 mitochondrial [Tieghemiomyces parasiticus]
MTMHTATTLAVCRAGRVLLQAPRPALRSLSTHIHRHHRPAVVAFLPSFRYQSTRTVTATAKTASPSPSDPPLSYPGKVTTPGPDPALPTFSVPVSETDPDRITSSIPTRVLRPNETVEQQRKRIIYQTRKRGILENDLLLANFIDRHITGYTIAQLRELDLILETPDWNLYYYLTDKMDVPADLVACSIWPDLKAYVREERVTVLMMPRLP